MPDSLAYVIDTTSYAIWGEEVARLIVNHTLSTSNLEITGWGILILILIGALVFKS